MVCYLGIDIGTHESKGVLADYRGKILAMEVIGHDVDNPQPGMVFSGCGYNLVGRFLPPLPLADGQRPGVGIGNQMCGIVGSGL